ncbi:MAG: YybH family protein [Ignavibacteriales bacterium]
MKTLIFILFLALTTLITAQVDPQKERTAVMNSDTEFSDLSRERGMHEAFLAYIANDGVLLRQDSYPVKGKDKVAELFKGRPDTSFVLTWKPMAADVAASGELAYTYGTYEIKNRAGSVIGDGTYVTIWKKDKAGNWKFVLDTGNEGLKPRK